MKYIHRTGWIIMVFSAVLWGAIASLADDGAASVSAHNAAAGSSASSVAAPDAPKIQFKELIHDFGKQFSNTELKHSYEFKNAGKSMLVIGDVKGG